MRTRRLLAGDPLRFALAGVLLACGLGCSAPSPLEPRRPNIILMVGDDHGWRDFGFMGSEVAHTPNLDRLAEEGVVFSQGYSTASVCRPALLSLLTGLYPHQWEHRIAQLRAQGVERGPFAAIQDFQTLPGVLTRGGYATLQAGKYFEGTFDTGGFTAGMNSQLTPEEAGGEFSAGGAGIAIVRATMEPLFDFVREHADEPFFVWFTPMLPHRPHSSPERYRERFADSGLDPIDVGYHGNIAWFDDAVGQIVALVESLGLRDDTLIVYTVDNGWNNTRKPLLSGAQGKGTMQDVGFRAPIIFHWPGRLAGGRVLTTLVSQVDLFPTLLSYAGQDAPSGRDGRDLAPLLEGEASEARDLIVGQQEVTLWTLTGFTLALGRFLRTERWHYFDLHTGRVRLYDIEADPDEQRDVAARHPELVARFRETIEAELARHTAMLQDE